MNAHRHTSWLTLALGINFLLQGGDSDPAWPLPEWSRARPRDVAMDESQLVAARDYARTGGGSGYVVRQGKLAFTWGDPQQRYDLNELTVVMPTLDVVVARAGQSWKRTTGADHYEVLKPFLLPIVAAASAKLSSGKDSSPFSR
jgi:hypothetical protein